MPQINLLWPVASSDSLAIADGGSLSVGLPAIPQGKLRTAVRLLVASSRKCLVGNPHTDITIKQTGTSRIAMSRRCCSLTLCFVYKNFPTHHSRHAFLASATTVIRWGYLRSWLHQSRQAHITRQLHRSQSSWHFRKQLLLYTHRGQAGGEPPRHLHFLVSPENLETLASPLEPSAWKGTESSPKLAGTAPKRR